ncbi:BnaA02g27930D [Brassica napus]|uniref:BnaA02g27930D protein n=1 Tax=Brassica napus TaxID=3708 RepID=A0A078HW39_BRANA|nr:BnaA02g27930D [Brassica napus]
MGEPNRKPFLGRKPIILNPNAPLHSLKVRERDACQDPHCEGPRITRPPRVDRTTIREARVERSKPHLFTESATKSPPWSPNPLKLLISKHRSTL